MLEHERWTYVLIPYDASRRGVALDVASQFQIVPFPEGVQEVTRGQVGYGNWRVCKREKKGKRLKYAPR